MWTARVAGSGQVSRCASQEGSVCCGGVARWMTSSSVPSWWRSHAGLSPASIAAARRAADGVEDPVADLGGLLGAGGGGDLAGVGERREVGELGGGGVQALPQQRHCLRAVEQPGVDPAAP